MLTALVASFPAEIHSRNFTGVSYKSPLMIDFFFFSVFCPSDSFIFPLLHCFPVFLNVFFVIIFVVILCI